MKNRNREKYTFANINLLGKCNANCFFCLGKDIEEYLTAYNHLMVHFSEWENFETFLSTCEEHGIKNLYLTGQTADGLQYNYLTDLITYLQDERGFIVGLRSNGYLALHKMSDIQKMKGEIGYSIHTFNGEANYKIMGRMDIPRWDQIIPQSGDNVRISIVLNRHNAYRLEDILKALSVYENVKYIQVRKVSTDTRKELLNLDMYLFEEIKVKFSQLYKKVGEFNMAEIFNVYGKDVSFWSTVETSVNSLNYFTDGVCSDEYFIVEGYLKNKVVLK